MVEIISHDGDSRFTVDVPEDCALIKFARAQDDPYEAFINVYSDLAYEDDLDEVQFGNFDDLELTGSLMKILKAKAAAVQMCSECVGCPDTAYLSNHQFDIRQMSPDEVIYN